MVRTSSKYAGDPGLVALGQAVKVARSSRGLSQEDLAYLSHVDRSYLSSIERGDKNTGIVSLRRVAQAMELTLADLMILAGL